MAVTIDLIDGASLRETKDGFETERVAIVSGVTGDAHTRLWRAASQQGVPQVGEYHPSIPWIQVAERRVKPKPNANGVFDVICTYRMLKPDEKKADEHNDSNFTVHVGTSVIETATQIDADGAQIKVKYTHANLVLPEQVGSVQTKIPFSTVTIMQKMGLSPLSMSKKYTGVVDKDGYLCLGIEGESTDSGLTYDVRYNFGWKADGWRANVVYVMPETSQLAPLTLEDIKAGNGILKVKVMREVPESFGSLLGLSSVLEMI